MERKSPQCREYDEVMGDGSVADAAQKMDTVPKLIIKIPDMFIKDFPYLAA